MNSKLKKKKYFMFVSTSAGSLGFFEISQDFQFNIPELIVIPYQRSLGLASTLPQQSSVTASVVVIGSFTLELVSIV